ncbi:hypothetical protein D4Z76_09410, partial [Campylobacter coli]
CKDYLLIQDSTVTRNPGERHSHSPFLQLDIFLVIPDTEGSHIQHVEGRIWQLGLEGTEEVSQRQKYLPLII